MYENKIFQIALIFSLLVHSVFFFTLPHCSFSPAKRPIQSLEITYYKIIKEEPKPKKLVGKKPETVAKRLPDIKKEEILKLPKPEARKVKRAPEKISRAVGEIKKAEEKKFQAVVDEEKDNVKKATYISYYQAVREKIRGCADQNYPRNRNLGRGEVFLSFVVTSSGELLQVGVVDEKSINNAVLRNIAINSVRDASPFPSFPTGMSHYQITFNVVISFENQ